MKLITKLLTIIPSGAVLFLGFLSSGCGNAHNNQVSALPQEQPQLPVVSITAGDALDTAQFPGTVQGISNVEIQPQVSGYISHIYVDEGALVHKGQVLFRIDDRPYREQLANALAVLKAAEANVVSAQIGIDRQKPLVEKKVVAPINLKAANVTHASAAANVAQARAAVQSARISLGFCTIKAPVSGYVGTIPNKLGSLVGPGGAQPLTTLSDVHKIYVYFSMGEDAYMDFQQKYPGNSVFQKIKNMPSVLLKLPNGQMYGQPGQVQVVEGQFNQNTASIQFRAVFDNPGGILRTGNTGVILIPNRSAMATLVPIASTTDLQDKVYVWKLDEKNTVHQSFLTITGKTGTSYVVSDGIRPGDRIVASGFDRLAEGTPIKPTAAQ